MATNFLSFDGLIGIKSQLQDFTDMSLHFYDMANFQKRVKFEHFHPITKKLRGCGLVKATSFPVAIQALKLIYECIHHYNLETKQIVLPNDTILISIDRQMVVNFLHVPD